MVWPSTSNGACSVASRRPVTSLICASVKVPGRTATNSSPPTRARVSLSRSVLRRRAAAMRSTASPTGWPRPSLTFLKPSRPTVATEKPWPERRACGDHHADPVRQQQAVGQFGQRIVGGHVAQPLFGGVLGRHVAPDRQQFGGAGGPVQRDRRSSNQMSAFGRLQARLDQHRLGAGDGAGDRAAQRRLVGFGRQRRERACRAARARGRAGGCARRLA